MPRADGALAVPGSELPANTSLIKVLGSWANTEELPAIFGSALRLPCPSVRWQAAQLST